MGVDWIAPVINRIVWFNWTSIKFVWQLFSHTGAYSTVEKTSAMDDVRWVSAEAPVIPQSFWMILLSVFILAAVFSRCFL